MHAHVPPGVKANDQQLEFCVDMDMKSVAKLHGKLLAQLAKFESTAGEWERICNDVEYYRTVIGGVAPVGCEWETGNRGCCARWFWKWRLEHAPRTYRALAVLAGVMTALMAWCEIFIPVPDSVPISPWGGIVQATTGGLDTFLFAVVPLAYMSGCTFTSLFQLNWFSAYRLTQGRTDASGLLFNAYYLCRLQFCIGFNYLLMLDWPSADAQGRVPLTAFHQIVAGMAGEEKGIMWWFLKLTPLIIAVFACVTFFNVHSRVLACLDVDVYARPKKGDAEHQERITEGQRLVERELRRERSASGTLVGDGGIKSMGYRAPRRSFLVPGSSKQAASGGGARSGDGAGQYGPLNSQEDESPADGDGPSLF